MTTLKVFHDECLAQSRATRVLNIGRRLMKRRFP